MTRPRHIAQPGAAPKERAVVVEARGRAFSFALEPGARLIDAVARGFSAQGFTGGVVELGEVALAPFAYVMPALSKTGENAAFYSETFRPRGVSRISSGALTLGRRDGAPFFHCHAIWRENDGAVRGGHVLPDETMIAERAIVTAFGTDGAIFEAAHDPETNFKLFGPISAPSTNRDAPSRAIVVRLRPNQDFAGALEELCVRCGVARARIRGGVGSTIGAAFTDGRVVENFATEVFVRSGAIAPGSDGRPEAVIDVGLVDYAAEIASGRLRRGDNPVLMTFELVLEAE